MPDLLLLTWSFVAAAGCSGGCFLAVWLLSLISRSRLAIPRWCSAETTTSAAITLGLCVGFAVQGYFPSLPPVSALDRCVVLLLPLFLGLEGFLGWFRDWRRLAFSLRTLLAAFVPVVLLFQSVYFDVSGGRSLLQPPMEGIGLLAVTCAIAVLAMALLQRSGSQPPLIRAIVCAGTLHVAGVLIMLGGWIRGGAAVLPMTGACCGAMAADIFWGKPRVSDAAARWAGWSLLNIVFCGHFFGRLTAVQGAALLLTAIGLPLLVQCLPNIHGNRRTAVLLASTATILGLLLWFAWSSFSEKMRPLIADLGSWPSDDSVSDQAGDHGISGPDWSRPAVQVSNDGPQVRFKGFETASEPNEPIREAAV